MASFGPFLFFAMFKLVLAMTFVAVSMATKGWMMGYIYRFPYTFQEMEVGLFSVSTNIKTYDISYYFSTEKEDFLVTAVLMGIGGGFLLLATISLVLFLVMKNKSGRLIIAYAACVLISGILTIIGSTYFRINIEDDIWSLDLGYSYYLALMSGILTLSSIASVGSALKRGEVGATSQTERATTASTNIQHMEKV